MQPQKNNAGEHVSTTGIAKGFQSFGENCTDSVLEIAKELREQRVRRDNAALRLPRLACGCHDLLRCRCRVGAA